MNSKLFVFTLLTLCVLSVTIQGQTDSTVRPSRPSTSRPSVHPISTTPHHPHHSTTQKFYPQICRCNCCAGYQCTPFLQGIFDYNFSAFYCTDEHCQAQCAIAYPTTCSKNIPYGTTNIYCDY